MYPKIFLVYDNCFAIKRWVEPEDWAKVVKDLGVYFVEASTDNEMDPLFAPRGYMEDWADRVLALEKAQGVKVVNFYTGYQTYRTVGLAHPDPRIREKLLEGWHKVLVDVAARINAGIGFSFFAMTEKVLQDPVMYEKTRTMVLEILSDLVAYAYDKGPVHISVEQMYAPHQPPWTIQGSKEYLRDLYALTKKPSYITIDLGHQIGQRKFVRLSAERIKELLGRFRAGEWVENMWLGPASAYRIFFDAVKGPASKDGGQIGKIESEMNNYPYLFASDEDGDTYRWLEELGCYSPIVHMQQTNGVTSSHAPFTRANNERGIIKGDNLLRAIAASYEKEAGPGMPPKCGEIYLSLELFSGNTDLNHDTMRRLKETVEYWRRFIPRDGVELDKLL